MCRKHFNLFLLVFIIVFSILFANFVSATTCWTYTSQEAGCNVTNGCKWKNDSWSTTGWCEELNCWSLYSQSECTSTVVPGKNCTWQPGQTSYWCEKLSCWSLSGSSANQCGNNSLGLSCQWSDYCYQSGGYTPGVNCWNYNTSATCMNATGCSWGQCMEKGCWSYTSNNTCNAAKDPWSGKNCIWDNSSGYAYCNQNSCWIYGTNYSATTSEREALCRNTTATGGLICDWRYDSCQDVDCWTWSYTNETACVNNTANLSCIYDMGSYCNKKDCWSYNIQSTCQNQTQCLWKAYVSSGWCNEVNCWTWDSWNGGNNNSCINNGSIYGLDCIWNGNPAGNTTNGWCYKNIATTSCANKTTERECMDTFYCWWQYNNWNNVSAGGTCNAPGSFAAITTNTTIFNDWSPGCYIFDMNSSDCNNIVGCNYTNGLCQLVADNPNNVTIINNGINCSMVNDSRLCNNIPILSSCCTWQNGSCAENKLSSACKDQMQQKSEDSCEDAETQARCNQIAGSPWYMPCNWQNSTSKCMFKTTDVFGNGSQSIMLINNKMSCEAAGGKWLTENYCEGNVSIPTGRCEYKFDEEDNCNKACFACELKNSEGTTVNATNAVDACKKSKLAMCEFIADTNAPNGIGYCKAKEQFKKGIAGDCDSNCGDCTFKGDPRSNTTTEKPSYYCANSKANSDGGGCKWITDNSTTTGGYCIKKGEKTCEDACDRCSTQTACSNIGRTAVSNVSGGCRWEEGTKNCVSNIGGDAEICWNGVDDNSNNLIDCADSSCYADTFCGFVSGDCSGWITQANCNAHNSSCEWITDKWGSWCDVKGAQCWKYNTNEANCTGVITIANENLNITTARLSGNNINETKTFPLLNLGAGWVEGSITIRNSSGTSLVGNYTVNYITYTIIFLNNTFMISGGGSGNITNVTYQYYLSQTQKNCQWNSGTGSGWCERDYSKQEVCMGLNRTACISPPANNSGCNWTVDSWCQGTGNNTDWCKTSGGGWCDNINFKPKECWRNDFSSAQCNNVSGCNWKADQYSMPRCEVNWSANCWQFNNNTTCAQGGCWWRNDTWNPTGWCEQKINECYSKSQGECNALGNGNMCRWKTENWGSFCDPICYNANESICTSPYCIWKGEPGWCEESGCWNFNQTGCSNQTGIDAGCRWKESGWCDPKGGGFSTASGASAGGGGGGGGMGGGDCFKYDGNRSLCTNKSIINISCGWTINNNPKCEVDWSRECWRYNSTTTGCNETNGCWWNQNEWGGWCTNIMDQCWSNVSYQSWNNSEWIGNCTSNYLCTNNSWGGCEPRCSSLDSTSCANATYSGKCKYISGWCNPGTMTEMFNNMEAGASAPIGMDACGTENISQASVDICGFGMKDMGDSYGFGAGVKDFSNASVCNKEKLSSFVMGMAESSGGGMPSGGGGMTTFGTEKTGTGNETITYIMYLDSDGSTTGGCALDSNSSAGYEFRFKYASQWSSNLSKAVETFNADKCDNSNWKATDIKLSTWKKKMCSDIGGPMIAVKKDDLTKFPTLYDSTKDLRIYVATIGDNRNNIVYNISYPTDTAGPGWTTPGSVDFEINSAFDYGANSAKFEDILRKGFLQGEDCFNNVDDDSDGNVDCDDWDCEYSSKCSGLGVNAINYLDTSSPLVTGIKIEEYPNAALIMYDTNKPTNGTLELYGFGDAQCLNKTNNIYDIGILSTNVPDHKLWHTAVIYQTNETMNNKNVSIQWPLVNGSTYNYKLKVCDSNGKCAISRCSSFKTVLSEQKCSYCNFVTRIKAPTGWVVSYDVDRNGTYEHVQGQVCGPNAGMKMNYTAGRKVNIKLASSDGSIYIEFLNASLTKSGLNDKVRTISSSGDMIHDTSKGTVGLSSETRDKIINSLHPEVCRIKIPVLSGATCDKLYHCDDNGEKCVDRTSVATLVDPANCVWNVPYCEFSTYKTSAAPGGTPPGGGGGGGGGGAAAAGATYTLTSEQLAEGFTKELAKNDKFKFTIKNETHHVTLASLTNTSVTINVSSTPQQATLSVGEEKKFEVTDDNYYDISVKLNSINSTSSKASLTIKSIYEEIPAEEEEEKAPVTGEEIKEEEPPVTRKTYLWIITVVVIIIIAIILRLLIKKRR